MLLDVILLLYSLRKVVVFGFTQGPLAIYTLVLGLPSSMSYGLNHTECTLSKIKYWLVTSSMFIVPTILEQFTNKTPL